MLNSLSKFVKVCYVRKKNNLSVLKEFLNRKTANRKLIKTKESIHNRVLINC